MCVEDTLIITTKKYNSRQEMFSTAGRLAADQTRAMGLPVTSVKNNKIVKEYADGSVEILGDAPDRIKTNRKIIDLKKYHAGKN